MKDLRYAFIAIISVVMTKLIQVAIFDIDKYNKIKDSHFYKHTKKSVAGKEEESTNQLIIKKNNGRFVDGLEKVEVDKPEVIAERSGNEKKMSSAEHAVSNYPFPELDIYLAAKNEPLAPNQLRSDVIIRYYHHDKDDGKVYTLKKLGYYIHRKEAAETAAFMSNVIYYGRSVSIEDIQIVAHTLLKQGLSLKSIQKTKFDWKSNAIEIGTDTLLLDAKNLSLASIQNFSK